MFLRGLFSSRKRCLLFVICQLLVPEIRERHATRSIALGVAGLCRGIVVLVHLVKEGVLVVKPAHVPLLLDVIDVHLHVQTLVQLLSRDVICSPCQFSVTSLCIHQAESLCGPCLLLRLVESSVGLFECLHLVLVFHLHLLKCRVDQVLQVRVLIAAWQV